MILYDDADDYSIYISILLYLYHKTSPIMVSLVTVIGGPASVRMPSSAKGGTESGVKHGAVAPKNGGFEWGKPS